MYACVAAYHCSPFSLTRNTSMLQVNTIHRHHYHHHHHHQQQQQKQWKQRQQWKRHPQWHLPRAISFVSHPLSETFISRASMFVMGRCHCLVTVVLTQGPVVSIATESSLLLDTGRRFSTLIRLSVDKRYTLLIIAEPSY